MSFRKFLSIAALALLASGVPSAAKADFITQTFTHAAGTVPYTFSFNANQFNASLGTLTSVQISVTTDIVGQVSVINYNAVAENFTNATSGVPVTLSGPNGLGLSVTATTPGVSGIVAAGTGPAFGPFPSSTPGVVTISGLTDTTTTSTTITDPGQTSAYVGNGSNNLSFSFTAGNGIYGGSAPPNVFFGGSATADANITITYNYTPSAVPEPASFAMVAMGLGGLVVVRRVRRRTA